jgi:REP element-mobilizing transposase RayT
MISSIDQLTTVVSGAPMPFFERLEPIAAASSLYFHLVLRVKGEILSDEQEENLKKYIAGFVRKTGGQVKSLSFAQNRVHVLVGLSQFCALGTFVRELKLVSATYTKRKLGAENFGWEEKYDAFTVSWSQIERVGSYIRRQKWLETEESYASSWNRIASCELY